MIARRLRSNRLRHTLNQRITGLQIHVDEDWDAAILNDWRRRWSGTRRQQWITSLPGKMHRHAASMRLEP